MSGWLGRRRADRANFQIISAHGLQLRRNPGTACSFEKHLRRFSCLAVLAALGLGACPTLPADSEPVSKSNWVSSWVSALQIPEPRSAIPPDELTNSTLRQIIRISLGGSRIRLRVSNVYGTAPLTLGKISIARAARPDSSEIDPLSSRQVTFSRQETVTIPAGAYMVSDPIEFSVEPLIHLAVSIYFPLAPEQQTGHPGSRATSYIQHGNHVARKTFSNAKRVDHWYQVAAPGSAHPFGRPHTGRLFGKHEPALV